MRPKQGMLDTARSARSPGHAFELCLDTMATYALSIFAVLAGLLTACGPSSGGRVTCGMAVVVGPTTLLGEFSVPRQTLSEPPERMPNHLVVRFVSGTIAPAVVGRTDSAAGWIIGVDGGVPAKTKPTFGVLVLDRAEKARGVMVYEGIPIEGAPAIGTVAIGATTIPLIGVQTDPVRFEDPRCPFFPDSVLP